MQEENRPFVAGKGKVGFKVNGRMVIPAVYDYVRHAFGKDIFYAEKDERILFLDMNGKEVLTRVRWFENEDRHSSPFCLRTDSFDCFTAIHYIGRQEPDNPNVILYNGEWVELERYGKEEISGMLVNPDDDLALTEKELALFYSDFSYEYSIYFAKAKGEDSLKECMSQFQKMDAFDNSWHFVVKLWQAPGEHVSAHALREFRRMLKKKRQLGDLVIDVGHDVNLNPGEVHMLLVTHYHERCRLAAFEYDWERKCRTQTVTELMAQVPELKRQIDEVAMDKYKEEVFLDQMRDVIAELEYYPSLYVISKHLSMKHLIDSSYLPLETFLSHIAPLVSKTCAISVVLGFCKNNVFIPIR